MQPQTRTDPPPCFTEGLKHSFVHLSPTLLLTYSQRLDPKFSNLDSSLHNTLFHWSSFQSFWALAYLSLFTLFPFHKSGFLDVTLPWRPFLIKLLQTVKGSTWHPNAASRCWARSLLDFLWSLKEETMRNFSSEFESFLGLPVPFLSLTSPDSSNFFITAWILHLKYPVCLLISLWEWPCWCKSMILCLSNSVIFGILIGMMWLKVGLLSKLPMNDTHTTCVRTVCNAQACLTQTWCTRPFPQQSFWHGIVGHRQVLAMTVIRVPFHLGLQELGACCCSSVRGGHTKYLPL